jgi:hypothetical protein
MAYKNNTLRDNIGDHKTAVGAGLAALVAAAAGAYYFYGHKKSTEHRKNLKTWAVRMKGDVMEQIENLKDVNEEAYHSVVDGISEKYQQLKSVDPADVAALAARMRMHWKDIQRDINSVTSGGSARRASSSTSRRAKTVRARKPSTKKSNGNSAS